MRAHAPRVARTRAARALLCAARPSCSERTCAARRAATSAWRRQMKRVQTSHADQSTVSFLSGACGQPQHTVTGHSCGSSDTSALSGPCCIATCAREFMRHVRCLKLGLRRPGVLACSGPAVLAAARRSAAVEAEPGRRSSVWSSRAESVCGDVCMAHAASERASAPQCGARAFSTHVRAGCSENARRV